MKRATMFLLLSVLGLLASSTALAQRPLQQVLDLNRQAMEHYNNLEIPEADAKLHQALTIAQRANISGAALARTYLNIGVVSVGGMGDNAAGMSAFESALRADASAQLDPLTSTPDIQQVFNLARTRAGSGNNGGNNGGGNNGGGDNNGGGNNGGGDNNGGGTSEVSGNIPHVPAMEQLAQTALPVFVDVPDDAPVQNVYLYYKGLGMRDFRRVEMPRMPGGFGLEIPCADIFQPNIQYYIVAFGEDGSPLGFAGTAESPIEVPIVSTRTQQAPALPGRAPPEQCSDSECPPGMAGCHNSSGAGGMGSTCLSDSECNSGLECQDNFCVSNENGDGGGGGGGDDSDWPRFFVHLGGTLGLAYATAGMPADGFADETIPGSTDVYVPEGTTAECVDNLDEYQDYCVRIETPGFVPTFAANIELGWFFFERLGASVFFRWQPDSGTGSLAAFLFGARLHYLLTDPAVEGINATVHVGTSVGQIQPKPPQNGAIEPYIRSGLNGIDVGGTVGYRFMRNIGVFLNADFNFLIPVFLFDLDLTAGLEIAF